MILSNSIVLKVKNTYFYKKSLIIILTKNKSKVNLNIIKFKNKDAFIR